MAAAAIAVVAVLVVLIVVSVGNRGAGAEVVAVAGEGVVRRCGGSVDCAFMCMRNRPVQHRQLGAAEQGHGEYRADQQMFDHHMHAVRKPSLRGAVKCGLLALQVFSRHLFVTAVLNVAGTDIMRGRFMRRSLKVSLLLTGALAIATPAWSHGLEDCTKEAKENWQPQADAEAEAAALAAGYKVSKSAIEGSCYAVFAEKDGKKVELLYNPADLQLVDTHAE